MTAAATKPAAFLKWADEQNAQPINRATAAATIRKNRRAAPQLRVRVQRKYRETYIVCEFLGVACCIYTEPRA